MEQCITEEDIPLDWKVGHLSPIHKKGKKGCLEDDSRSGLIVPATRKEIVEKIQDMVLNESQLNVLEISEVMSISTERVRHFLVNVLDIFKVSTSVIRLHPEFIPQGATVDKILYKEILGRLRNSISRKRPELWHRKNWLLLHDNAPAHRSILVQEELPRQQVAVLPHPPYSPDLAPCDFFSLSPHEINPTWA
ncbi:hypothetical protein ANN_02396 [Periplaneta americana]|uniref:Histone-lysine N-methyltransferase SETMAR n=1 Tax=Periplaneta americana TaxID=6978 RepID=A0ABQ8TYN0_PERAM|nr:hypothetical protein ANN_02396 [Periplaneta americana]